MTNEQKQVKDWMSAYGQETPEKPTIPSAEIRKLRAKLILEEALETIAALGICPELPSIHCQALIPGKNFIFYEHGNPNLTEILDGCEDLKVVTEGTLVACGLTNSSAGIEGYDPHFNEVMRSNWSKMWTPEEVVDWETSYSSMHPDNRPGPIFFSSVSKLRYLAKDSSGKVIKSLSYSPPQFNI